MRARPNACYNFWACIKEHQGFVALRFRLSLFARPKFCCSFFGLPLEKIKDVLPIPNGLVALEFRLRLSMRARPQGLVECLGLHQREQRICCV